MSSRSLAAARAKRAGENAPPVSGMRPGTSIGSFAQSFTQQMPPQQTNVRVEQQQQNSLPFKKISISDAIGLITLRLGRVEKWIIETDHENDVNNSDASIHNSSPIDNSVLSSIINRIESIEKKDLTPVNNESVTKLAEDIKIFSEQLTRISSDVNKHTIEIAKNTEQVFKFNRELTETKDILKTFMIKYDLFAEETNNKFCDFENALGDLEKNISETEIDSDENNETEQSETNSNTIMSVDLKNIIKQELADNT
jgi:hypothetical protein